MREKDADVEIERAIQYLVHSFEASGDNPKPVILHSTRVGMDLYNRGYTTNIVVAGLLHDLLEDTDVRKDEITAEFGEEVAAIVEATTFDRSIEDYTERYQDTLTNCFEMGRAPVVVKAADTLDNSQYYHLAGSEELRQNLLAKMEFFIEHSKPYIGDDPIYQELKDAYASVTDRMDDIET